MPNQTVPLLKESKVSTGIPKNTLVFDEISKRWLNEVRVNFLGTLGEKSWARVRGTKLF